MSTATTTPAPEGAPGRPPRPAGYWERVTRIVDQAPPLADSQRAAIRAAFFQPAPKEAAA
ncbi:hypothetical protein SAMN05216532_3981 [Streptomyces sp. 2231.1]|uniref:hypothetical protein n=1 Tax=Streptomyces sp. 2231.1 TaxID=1855347 RepID=UPI00089A227A|nr:hypothetical protein [Streptomyces sp. 2231.1]SED26039.1 hypothetical protein SAMN05216532_3981 [Streptomyces sp. 2231.1]